MDLSKRVWTGNGFCSVASDRPEYRNGARGAYVVVACTTESIRSAAKLIEAELTESGLILRGFEYLMDIVYLDRQLSDYEEILVSRLDSYPVQFEDVHFFRTDS